MTETFSFSIMVYKDQTLARTLIPRLQTLYPGVRISVISDGITDASFATFCSGLSVPYVVGSRLKLPIYCGQWTQRFMQDFITNTTSDVLIHLDPDTKAQKAITAFPSSDIFGFPFNTVNNSIGLCGGLVGIRRAAVVRILASGFLLDSEYQNNLYSYPRFSTLLKTGETFDANQVSRQDCILGDIVAELGLTLKKWPEVCDVQKAGLTQPAHNFAFIHPSDGS